MEYELYVDLYFVVNFAVNFITLSIVAKLMDFRKSQGRLICTSAAVAVLSIVFLWAKVEVYPFIGFVLHQLIPVTVLCLFAFNIRERSILLRSILITYIVAVFMAGILQLFEPYIAVVSIFITILVGTYYTILTVMGYLKLQFKCNDTLYTISLNIGEHKEEIKGLYDTGNCLKDPISGKEVCIIGGKLGQQLLQRFQENTLRYIEFHTVGGRGEIPIIEIPAMCIYRENKEHRIEKPMIAITKESVSEKDTYQIILNRDII